MVVLEQNSQRGIAVGVILIAVVLIAALLTAISNSISTAGQSGDKEASQVYAATIIEQALQIQQGVQRANATNSSVEYFIEDYLSGRIAPPVGAMTQPGQWEIVAVNFTGDGVSEVVMYIDNLREDVVAAINRTIPGGQLGGLEVNADIAASSYIEKTLRRYAGFMQRLQSELLIGAALARPNGFCRDPAPGILLQLCYSRCSFLEFLPDKTAGSCNINWSGPLLNTTPAFVVSGFESFFGYDACYQNYFDGSTLQFSCVENIDKVVSLTGEVSTNYKSDQLARVLLIDGAGGDPERRGSFILKLKSFN